MKRFLWLIVCIASSSHALPTKKIKDINTQLCLNTPRDFGTKHFIVGYKEKVNPRIIDEQPQKKQQPPRINHKKQKSIYVGGAELIDPRRTTQSFFSSVHDIADILLHVISLAEKKLYITAFSLTDIKIADLVITKHKSG